MSWGTFVLAAVGVATLGIILLGLIGFVHDEILDSDDAECERHDG